MVGFLSRNIVNLPLAEDTPQTNSDTSKAGEKGQIVSRLVTGQAIGALAVAFVADDGVTVIDGTI